MFSNFMRPNGNFINFILSYLGHRNNLLLAATRFNKLAACVTVVPVAIQRNTTRTHLRNTQFWYTDFSLSRDPCITRIWSSQNEG